MMKKSKNFTIIAVIKLLNKSHVELLIDEELQETLQSSEPDYIFEWRETRE